MAWRSVGAKQLSEKCCNVVNWALRNTLQWNLKRNSNIFFQEKTFEYVVCEMAAILYQPQRVKLSASTDKLPANTKSR